MLLLNIPKAVRTLKCGQLLIFTSTDVENGISKYSVPSYHVIYCDEESLVILVLLLSYFPQSMTVLILKKKKKKNGAIYVIVAPATGAA